jgi:hypothetical protein
VTDDWASDVLNSGGHSEIVVEDASKELGRKVLHAVLYVKASIKGGVEY